uniref:Uncharacterized protein n=1 Tax=Bursaphelenchus xylophilus TaxID=6326 RepID=A0A1I7S5E5_BURXY
MVGLIPGEHLTRLVLCVSEFQPVGFSFLGSNPGIFGDQGANLLYQIYRMFKSIAFLTFLIALAASIKICPYSDDFMETLPKVVKDEKRRHIVVDKEYKKFKDFCLRHGTCDTLCYHDILACLDFQRVSDFVNPGLDFLCCYTCGGRA